ncbi:hypothetical protein MMC07_003205 [Pseudocyphellaria aurata]|nr:hypothetical protein [Pseudocyphellaria aurata]
MAPYLRSSRQPYGENPNTLSIITDRARPQDVLAVRGSTSPERDLDPTAPVFVNGQASAPRRSAAPGVNRFPQGHRSPEYTPRAAHNHTPPSGTNIPAQSHHSAEHSQNGVALRPYTAALGQNMTRYQSVQRSYGQNVAHHSGLHLPRPALVAAPTQSPLLLPPPRSAAVQYSPPHRPFHEPITAINGSTLDPIKNEPSSAELRSLRADRLVRRLDRLHELKKDNLRAFSDATEQLAALDKKIESLQLDGNDKLQELYKSELEHLDTDRAQDKRGATFKWMEAEIEEVMADLMVPHEAREEEEFPDIPGE